VLVTDVWARLSQKGRLVRYESDTIKSMFSGMRAALNTENTGGTMH